MSELSQEDEDGKPWLRRISAIYAIDLNEKSNSYADHQPPLQPSEPLLSSPDIKRFKRSSTSVNPWSGTFKISITWQGIEKGSIKAPGTDGTEVKKRLQGDLNGMCDAIRDNTFSEWQQGLVPDGGQLLHHVPPYLLMCRPFLDQPHTIIVEGIEWTLQVSDSLNFTGDSSDPSSDAALCAYVLRYRLACVLQCGLENLQVRIGKRKEGLLDTESLYLIILETEQSIGAGYVDRLRSKGLFFWQEVEDMSGFDEGSFAQTVRQAQRLSSDDQRILLGPEENGGQGNFEQEELGEEEQLSEEEEESASLDAVLGFSSPARSLASRSHSSNNSLWKRVEARMERCKTFLSILRRKISSSGDRVSVLGDGIEDDSTTKRRRLDEGRPPRPFVLSL